MDTDEKIKLLENRMQENFEIFNQKLNTYNEKINDIVVVSDGKIGKNQSSSFFNFDSIYKLQSKTNIVIFAIFTLIVFFILYKTKPSFVCDKFVDPISHFYEARISVYKLILYTVSISICTLIVGILSLFIYKMRT